MSLLNIFVSPSILRENREAAAELKFLLTRAQLADIEKWARSNLDADPHGNGACADQYRISSIYFDTANFDVFHRRGSFGRSKFRIRRYGEAETVFLERKLKTARLVSKRRSLVGMSDLPELQEPAPDMEWTGYWYHRRLLVRKLKPICQISYDRSARVALRNEGPIRLTIDQNIRARQVDGFHFPEENGAVPVSCEQLILELKFRGATPAIFKNLLTEFGLNPVRFSKYRLAAAALGIVSPETQNGSPAADAAAGVAA